MFKILTVFVAVVAIGICSTAYFVGSNGTTLPMKAMAGGSIYDFTMKDIDGNQQKLRSYEGKVIMIVNTASKCGNTPQYEGLEAIYKKYKDQGFVILGFPANNFMGQEPGTDKEIKEFCTLKYDVTFPMFSKISVKGDDQDPFYAFLTSSETDPGFDGDITWNFEKFLTGRDGKVIARFTPKTKPEDPAVIKAIEDALAAK